MTWSAVITGEHEKIETLAIGFCQRNNYAIMRRWVRLLPASALLLRPATAKCWIAPKTAPVIHTIRLLNFRNALFT